MNSASKNSSNSSLQQKAAAYMTTNTLLVVLALLAILGAGIYFYQTYKDFQKKMKTRESAQVVPNECPDYWEIDTKTKNQRGVINSITCRNVQLLGKCALSNNNTFTFGDEIFNNPKTAELARCKWAKQCGVAWSGYDNKC
jgi:hypothetical protein